MRETGKYQSFGNLRHFIPYALPPQNPIFGFDNEIINLLGEANFNLGRLNEMSKRLPDPERFIKAYIIKEALISSSIEGIHTTLVDVFEQPLKSSQIDKNTQLVLNYTTALEEGLASIKKDKMPIVSRIICSLHKTLMSDGDGDKASPGIYRKQSVKVGDLTPPPAPLITELMSDLEKYINEKDTLPPLIRSALVHVQFETIHPFLDGNGRIGRLLIILMLIEEGILEVPILYLSYYFKKHSLEYYQKLDAVRTTGDFESWVIYYLKAIRDSSIDAHYRAKEIEALEVKMKTLIQTHPKFYRMRESALSLLDILFRRPVVNITEISQCLGKSYNTIAKLLNIFLELKLVSETEDKKRYKIFRFSPYLEVLENDYS